MGAYDLTMRALPNVWVLEKDESAKALEYAKAEGEEITEEVDALLAKNWTEIYFTQHRNSNQQFDIKTARI